MLWFESSLQELYQSAIEAFPNTTKRQYAIDPIKITKLDWIPFVGVKTLFVRGTAQNEGREYNPIIVFKGITYHDEEGPGRTTLAASDGKDYYLEPLSLTEQEVLVRCGCLDFHWRLQHFNHLDKSLQGPNRKKYEAIHRPGSANPQEKEGLCKHLMKMTKALSQSGVFT